MNRRGVQRRLLLPALLAFAAVLAVPVVHGHCVQAGSRPAMAAAPASAPAGACPLCLGAGNARTAAPAGVSIDLRPVACGEAPVLPCGPAPRVAALSLAAPRAPPA